MDSDTSCLSGKEARQKVQLMVDCMKYHLDDIDCLKKSLLSIASLCSSHNNVKDFLRENGCLQFIFNLFTSCENTLLKETTLFCLACAVDQNVYSQRYMIAEYIFDHIHTIFQDKTSETKLRQAATFFISCISANNGSGQLNCRQSSCLIDLINLFRELIPKEMLSGNENIILGNATLKNADLFTTVCNSICACTNNPRNEENQDLCAIYILHPSLLLIQRCPHMPTVHSILNMIAVIVAGNVKNQEKIRKLNGIHTLYDLLRIFTTATKENTEFLKMAVTVTSTLDSCLLDNVSNAEQFGSCGGIKILVNLLHVCRHKHSELLQVILTVAHATDSSALNQTRFTEHGGLAVLVPLLSEPIEEELLATVKYVLQICVPDGSSQQKTDNCDSDNESSFQESCQEKEPGWLSDKLQAILHRLDNIENVGHQGPSVVLSSNAKALFNMKKAENKEIQQTEPTHHFYEQSEQSEDDDDGEEEEDETEEEGMEGEEEWEEEEEEEEEEDNKLPENSPVEASQLLLTSSHSHPEKLKSKAENETFKKPLPVNSVEKRRQMSGSESVSVFSEFDLNLTAKAKGFMDRNCLPDNQKNIQTNNMRLSTQEPKDHQPSVSTANASVLFRGQKSNPRTKKMSSICPGCASPNKNGKVLLTSRTYNQEIESNPNVCSYHRQIRKLERDWINNTVRKANKKWRIRNPGKGVPPKAKENSDVFDCISSTDELDITPPENESDVLGAPVLNKFKTNKPARRKRLIYSKEEIKNLKEGIEKMGHFWNQILNAYKFHPSRTAIDLANKYKQMKRRKLNQPTANKMRQTGFSLCEERRLERGFKKFGPAWTQIWKKYKFGPDKVPEDLRSKWRVLNK